jgi:hypothetical protein
MYKKKKLITLNVYSLLCIPKKSQCCQKTIDIDYLVFFLQNIVYLNYTLHIRTYLEINIFIVLLKIYNKDLLKKKKEIYFEFIWVSVTKLILFNN